ncbi:MAG: DUF167 domain-containing protein [Sedimentisphaerales bacterium]
MANLTLQKVDEGVVITVKIVPGSSPPTRICGLLNGMLKIKVAVAPEKGKANRCLVEFLAKRLGVKCSAINIISGQYRPVKHVQILGISDKILLRKLNLNKIRL